MQKAAEFYKFIFTGFQTHLSIWKYFIGLILVVLVLVIGHKLELYLPDLEIRVQQLGAFAPIGFFVLFVALTPLFASVDALCFAAGLLFSLPSGELCIIISTYVAAALIFFIGRYWLRNKVLGFIAGHKRFAALAAVISGRDAFKLMLLLRLTPLPFAMLSYALSITEVNFWSYLAATTGILVYNGSLVYLGYTAKHLSGLISGAGSRSAIPLPMLIGGFLLALIVLMIIAKKAEKELQRLHLDRHAL